MLHVAGVTPEAGAIAADADHCRLTPADLDYLTRSIAPLAGTEGFGPAFSPPVRSQDGQAAQMFVPISTAGEPADTVEKLRDALAQLVKGALAGLFDDHTTIDVDWSAPIQSLSLSRLEPLGDEAAQAADAAVLYRVPQQPSMDGNTVELTAEQTGQTVETILKDNERDKWFTAQEGLEYGFFDHIAERYGSVTGGGGVDS